MVGLGLSQLVDVLSRFESGNMRVDPQQCARLRHKNSTCTRCADHCPDHAITGDRAIKIDQVKCSRCGICAAVCPTGALEAASPTNAELLQRIEPRKQTAWIAFACPKVAGGPDERVIPVNCLGRLDESILVGAASWGIEQIRLVDGPCQACPHGVGRAAAARAIAESNALLQAFGVPLRISFVSQLPRARSGSEEPSTTSEVLSRRAFFTQLTRETQVAAALTVSSLLNSSEHKPGVTKGEWPHRVPATRQLLLEALRRLGPPPSADFESPNGAWATCHIKANCTGCQMCAFFCPTGALSKAEQDGTPALAFRVAHCTNCRLCQDLCFWNALDLSGTVDLSQALEDAPETCALASQANGRQSPDAKLKHLIQSIR